MKSRPSVGAIPTRHARTPELPTVRVLAPCLLTAGVALALATPSAQAAVVGELQAQLQIELGCEVNGGSNMFGLLDFGRAAPTWQNPLVAELSGTGSGTIEVTCSPGVGAFTVAIDGGLRGDRTLLRSGGDAGMSTDVVQYGLFRDAARTTEYIVDTPQIYSVPTDGQPVDVSVFGAIAPNPVAKNDGLFVDTLLVTIDL